jgi:hypothetical protein
LARGDSGLAADQEGEEEASGEGSGYERQGAGAKVMAPVGHGSYLLLQGLQILAELGTSILDLSNYLV